jgi:RNA polymerase sigma factor (sigma-70 family)
MPDDPDLMLARAVAAGDDSAIAAFIKRFESRFMTLAKKNNIPWSDCEDVAQAAIATAIDELERGLFRGEAKLSSWLYRIVSGKIVDYHRTAERNPLALDRRAVGADLTPIHPDQISGPPSNREVVLTVSEVLQAMPPGHREILELRLLQKLPSKMIAAQSGRKVGTINRKLWEAKRMFLDLYRERTNAQHQPTNERKRRQ